MILINPSNTVVPALAHLSTAPRGGSGLEPALRTRNGMTLVEIIVVISIIALLSAMVVAFYPGLQEQQRAAQGGTLLESWLRLAKSRAQRDGRRSGLRFLFNNPANPLQVTQCQYLEQPDDFFIPYSSVVGITGTTITFCPGQNKIAAYGFPTIIPLDFYNGMGTASPVLWDVQPGDFLQMNGVGQTHLITPYLGGQPNLSGAATTAVIPNSNGGASSLALYPILNTVTTKAVALPSGSLTLAAAGNLTLGCYLDIDLGTANQETVIVMGILPGNIVNVSPLQNPHAVGATVLSHGITATPPGLAVGKISSSGTTVTGSSTAFLTQTPIGSLIGNLTSGYFQVTAVASNTSLTIASTPAVPFAASFFNVANGGSSFRVIRAPRVLADEQLNLPTSIVVDLNLNSTYGNFLPFTLDAAGAPASLDILFSPSGTVVTPGVATDFLALWVRDLNNTNPFQMGPTIIGVHVRSGLIAAHQPNDGGNPISPPAGTDPYLFVRDGRAQ